MIFKITSTLLASTANLGRRDLYMSLCSEALYGNSTKCKIHIYKELVTAKLLNVGIDSFYYEVRSFDVPVSIRCGIIINGKRKTFCNLDQLIQYESCSNQAYKSFKGVKEVTTHSNVYTTTLPSSSFQISYAGTNTTSSTTGGWANRNATINGDILFTYGYGTTNNVVINTTTATATTNANHINESVPNANANATQYRNLIGIYDGLISRSNRNNGHQDPEPNE